MVGIGAAFLGFHGAMLSNLATGVNIMRFAVALVVALLVSFAPRPRRQSRLSLGSGSARCASRCSVCRGGRLLAADRRPPPPNWSFRHQRQRTGGIIPWSPALRAYGYQGPLRRIAAAITGSRASRACMRVMATMSASRANFRAAMIRSSPAPGGSRLHARASPRMRPGGDRNAPHIGLSGVSTASRDSTEIPTRSHKPRKSPPQTVPSVPTSATRILSPAGAVPTASGCPLAVGRAVLFRCSSRIDG